MRGGRLSPITARGVERAALALLGLGFVPVAFQAVFAPRSFFDDFPFGRGWVATDGQYNQHLVRDVGGLFLALLIVTAAALVWRSLVRPVALAWLVQGVLHLAYHLSHLDALAGADSALNVVSLGLVPALAVVALAASWRGQTASKR